MKRPYLFVACCLIAIGLLMFARHSAAAEPFALPKPSCYPIPLVSAGLIDARLQMRAEADVGIWWCETPTGMEEHYRAGNFGRPCEECFRVDITVSQLWDMDRAAFRRAITAAESEQLALAESLYEPRCAIDAGTAAATGVRDWTAEGMGVIRLDDKGVQIRIDTTKRASCYDWRVQAGKRYCSVAGLEDTKGRELDSNSFVACRIERAPAAGWPEPASALTAANRPSETEYCPIIKQLLGLCQIPRLPE
jgi:hypothetical protein